MFKWAHRAREKPLSEVFSRGTNRLPLIQTCVGAAPEFASAQSSSATRSHVSEDHAGCMIGPNTNFRRASRVFRAAQNLEVCRGRRSAKGRIQLFGAPSANDRYSGAGGRGWEEEGSLFSKRTRLAKRTSKTSLSDPEPDLPIPARPRHRQNGRLPNCRPKSGQAEKPPTAEIQTATMPRRHRGY